MNTYQIAYLLFFVTGTTTMGTLIVEAYRHRKTPSSRVFAVLMTNLMGVLLSQFLEVFSTDLSNKIFFLNVRFVLYTINIQLTVAIVLAYTGQLTTQWKQRLRWLWVAVGIVAIMAFTSNYHNLFRSNFRVDPNNILTVLSFDRGPLYQAAVVYIFGGGAFIVYRWFLAYRDGHIRFSVFLSSMVASFIPISVESAYLLGFVPMNMGPLALAPMSLVYWLGILRFRLFDMGLIARSIVLENMADAVIVLDELRRVVDINPPARIQFAASDRSFIGSKITDTIKEWPDWETQLQTWDHFQTEFSLEMGSTRSEALVKVSALRNPSQNREGWVLIFSDISAQKESEHQKVRLAALEERERIGRDLHDDIGQALGFFNVQAQAIRGLIERQKPDQAQAELERLAEVAQVSQQEIRRYILGLQAIPPTENQHMHVSSLLRTLGEYIQTLHVQYGFEVDLNLPDGDLPESLMTPENEVQFLKIVQEALTNSRKHSGVMNAQLNLTVTPDTLNLEILDYGKGFDLQSITTPSNEWPHFGLQILHQRAILSNGSLRIESTSGVGTRVSASFPRLLVQQANSPAWRVLLVDDHPLFREGLQTLLRVRGIHVVGVAANGREAVQLASTVQPDLILMDVELPEMNGVEATALIKAEHPEIRVVMLTVSANSDTLYAALRAGASGYLLKSLKDDAFYQFLQDTMRGESVISPELARRMLDDLQPSASKPASTTPSSSDSGPLSRLTERQSEVLTLVARGFSYAEVGKQLYLSERTVRYHMGQILQTLQVGSRREAIRLAHGQQLRQST